MSKLLIDDYPIQVLPNLAKIIGLNEAIFLQQLHYWSSKSGKSRDGKMWVYNTYEGWEDNFPFWSNATIRRIIKSLEDKNCIFTTSKYNAMKIDRTKWYAINYDKMAELDNELTVDNRNNSPSAQNEQMDVVNMSKPITRDYTETKKEKEEGIFSDEKHSSPFLKPSDEVITIRNYFEQVYYFKYKIRYHRHKAEQNTYIDKRLQEIIDEYGEETTKAFIDNYFKYKFNHNLIHFVEPGIIENRMYEVAY